MNSSRPLLNALACAGIGGESVAARQFLAYLSLLEKWNRRFNLTASTEWNSIGPLFEEAIWAAAFYPKKEILHLDIGSGAGFPAVPMRLLRTEMRLHLIESRLKRATFLETVARDLSLQGTVVTNARLQDHLRSGSSDALWDVVSWKAIRLGRAEVSLLLSRTPAGTQFWLFHGRDLPVTEPEVWERSVSLVRREACPAREGWYLSIYAKELS